MLTDWLPTALLDYFGVFVFAATGALVAARKQHDIITFMFFAAVTGTGGGTLRDLLIGAPIFWVKDQGYLGACALAAAATWFAGERLARMRAFLWLDAIGLAVYAVIGASKALTLGVAPAPAVVMGVLTAAFGGVLRDVLAGEPSVLLRREIYISAALLAAGAFVIARLTGAPHLAALIIGAGAGFTLRAGAILRGWRPPGYRANLAAGS